jgi:PAS domain S-box-containing protein
MLEIPANSNSVPKDGGLLRHVLTRRRGLLIAVSVVGIFMSLFLGWLFSRREQQFAKMQFDSGVEDRVQVLKSAFTDRLATLRFVSAFYAGSEEVERHEFRSFMRSILAENADIEFLAWVPQVPDGLRGDFEKQMRQDGFADLQIRGFGSDGQLHPADNRSEYYPVMFVEGHEDCRHLFGFDFAGDAAAQAAIGRVMANKRPTVAQCNLPGPNGKASRKLCLFEYAQSTPPAGEPTTISRRLNAGVVVSSIHLRMLLEDAIEPLPRVGVNMYLYEETPDGNTSLLLARPSRVEGNPLPPLENPPASPPDASHQIRFAMADQWWTAYCVPVQSYVPRSRSWEPFSAVCVGFLVTAILVGYLYLLTGRTQQVESLAAQRTEALRASEQRFRRLVDGAGDAFFLHDSQGLIVDVNQRACEGLGYSRDELTKMNVRDIDVQPYKDAEEDMPWSLPDAMYPMTFEGLHRRKNGDTLPVEIRLAFQDYAGQRWFLALVRDITERKHAEAALQAEQRLLRQLLELLETDRKLVAYEIHDGLAQQLSGLSLCLQAMQARRESDTAAALDMLPKAIELAGQSMQETRRLIGGLRPPILDESGVVAAIEYLVGEKRQVESAQIEFNHEVCFHHLARPLESAIFRIAQECLTNACRYSHSEKIEIDLKQADRTLQLRIQDWGVGFDPQQINGQHFGLRGIRERARLLGGQAEIVSAKNAGTTVTVQLPVLEQSIEENHGSEETI